MVFIDNYIFNKDVFIQFNSTVGEFVGYTELGVHNAQQYNNNPGILQQERAEVERYCKHNAENRQTAIADKTGKQHKILIAHVTHKTPVLNGTFKQQFTNFIIL